MKLTKFLNMSVLLLLGVSGFALTSCSSDDEPAVLEDVKVDGSAFELNEAGEASVQFTVTPADASIDNIALVNGAETFEVIKKAPSGNGKWTIDLKAIDLAAVRANNAVSILVAQSGDINKEISFNITDPYSISGKFELNNPREFNYYGAEADHKFETCLPFVITAKNEDDLTLLDGSATKVTNGVTSQVVSAADFVLTRMQGEEYGYVLRVKPEKLADVQAAIPVYNTVNFSVVLTSKNGRRDVIQLSAAACAPQGTPVEDEQLTATSAELSNPGFEKTVTIDVTNKLRHLGVAALKDYGDVVIAEIGLFNDKGEKVDEASFIPEFKAAENGNMICDFTISGSDQYTIAPGNYTWVQRFHVTMKFGGVEYQTACADLSFKIIVK